jgi:hypothetical protein
MKQDGAPGLSFERRASSAANEEFNDPASRREAAAPPAAGWDPYEVWRTRVKRPNRARRDRPREPRR